MSGVAHRPSDLVRRWLDRERAEQALGREDVGRFDGRFERVEQSPGAGPPERAVRVTQQEEAGEETEDGVPVRGVGVGFGLVEELRQQGHVRATVHRRLRETDRGEGVERPL